MKAIKLLLILSTLLAVICCTSCGQCSKKIDCPGYTDTLLPALFSYRDNQQLLFKTTANEQAVFTLKNTETTQPYQATGGALSRVYCEATKVFASLEKDTAGRSLFTVEFNGNSGSDRNAFITIDKNSLAFSSITDTGFGGVSINGFYGPPVRLSSGLLGNRSFSNLVAATRDTTTGKIAGIYKVYYSKPEGIVGYAEYPSLKTWVKQ